MNTALMVKPRMNRFRMRKSTEQKSEAMPASLLLAKIFESLFQVLVTGFFCAQQSLAAASPQSC
jgi:hypothetical protein